MRTTLFPLLTFSSHLEHNTTLPLIARTSLEHLRFFSAKPTLTPSIEMNSTATLLPVVRAVLTTIRCASLHPGTQRSYKNRGSAGLQTFESRFGVVLGDLGSCETGWQDRRCSSRTFFTRHRLVSSKPSAPHHCLLRHGIHPYFARSKDLHSLIESIHIRR